MGHSTDSTLPRGSSAFIPDRHGSILPLGEQCRSSTTLTRMPAAEAVRKFSACRAFQPAFPEAKKLPRMWWTPSSRRRATTRFHWP